MAPNTIYNFIMYKVDEYSESVKEQDIKVYDVVLVCNTSHRCVVRLASSSSSKVFASTH